MTHPPRSPQLSAAGPSQSWTQHGDETLPPPLRALDDSEHAIFKNSVMVNMLFLKTTSYFFKHLGNLKRALLF